MDTGAYMANQMDNQIESGIRMKDAFDEWLFEACNYKALRNRKEAHDIFPYVDLTDAKLSFLDGVTALEYSNTI